MAEKDIEPKLKLISNYLRISKEQQFVIPEYQRAYSWTISQCDKLWQDVENFIRSSEDSTDQDPYFFGTIILDVQDNQFNLIDGQQRTTTFILLLKALHLQIKKTLRNLSKTAETKRLEAALKQYHNTILYILYKADEEDLIDFDDNWDKLVKERVLLKNQSINEQYREELQHILSSQSFSEAEASCYKIPRKQKDNKYTNFFRNFKFFYEKLDDYNESQLNKFASSFLKKCQIIEIRSWKIEQAITMFNSLNSTGMPLSDADIISAKLYSNAGENKEQFNNEWEHICKTASNLSLKGIIGIDSVLQQLMYITRSRSLDSSTTTPGVRKYYTEINKDLLLKPLEICKSFENIVDTWDKIQKFPLVKLLLKFNENAKLFLISYLSRFKAAEIENETILPICECLIKLFTVLELVDYGYSSANFKAFLFSENLKLVDPNVSIDVIKEDFSKHINEKWTRDGLKESILEYDNNILVFLNEYLYLKEKDQASEFNFSENVNIEHIMPSSGRNKISIMANANISSAEEFESYVNKLGNKILLEEDINKSISNSWFKTKKQKSVSDKDGYKDSKYAIASSLVSYPKDLWEKSDIDIATNKVAERILTFIFS